jgi:hypothetical protein
MMAKAGSTAAVSSTKPAFFPYSLNWFCLVPATTDAMAKDGHCDKSVRCTGAMMK